MNYREYLDEQGRRYVGPVEGEEVCDFCLAPDPPWTYPAGAMDIVGHPVVNASDDPWGACETCHDFIESDDIEGLVEYAVDAQRVHVPEGSEDAQGIVIYPSRALGRALMLRNVIAFMLARTGAAYRE